MLFNIHACATVDSEHPRVEEEIPVCMGPVPEIIVACPFSLSPSPREPKDKCCVVPEHARSTVSESRASRE